MRVQRAAARKQDEKIHAYVSGADTRSPKDVMDNLRRFPAQRVMEEYEHGFRVLDSNGFCICAVMHGTIYMRGATSTHRTISHGRKPGE